MTTSITAIARNARRSTCLADRVGAMDVDVTLDLDGRKVDGEVTLVLLDGDYHVYGGQPDHWISNGLLREMHDLDDRAFRAACDALESAARELVEA